MYSTNINIIGGIPDFDLLFDVLLNFAHGKSSNEISNNLFTKDTYGIRTIKSRSRFLKAIKSGFLKFRSKDHQKIFFNLFKQLNLISLKKSALFFQLAINDRLFYELTANVFLRLYLAGRLTVDLSEFSAYLYNLRDNNTDIQNWSDSTIKITASKYLTLLKKFDFLKGRTKKEFKHITPDDATITYFIYLIKSIDAKQSNIMKNKYIPLIMITREGLIDRIKKMAFDNYFNVSTLGQDLKIDLKYSYEEIVSAIAKGYKSKI